MSLTIEFTDTVRFELKPDLTLEDRESVLAGIKGIRGVAGLEASQGNPNAFNVELNGRDTALGVMDDIRWKDGVKSTTITPKEWHELSARIAAEQGRPYSPKI